MPKRSLKINGTIDRNCERCGKPKNCNCFEDEGKYHLMCSDCMAEEYGYGKEQKIDSMKDLELCKDCDALTMRMNKDLTTINDTHVIQYFECDKCSKTMKKKIKKWRR